jgi:hypothetical protein
MRANLFIKSIAIIELYVVVESGKNFISLVFFEI